MTTTTDTDERSTVSAAAAHATSPASPAAATWSYRPHLDGMRAIAVYLVVAFHAGMSSLRGGFIGVDVFFVLSGYLVTGVLLRDVEGAGRGRVRFLRFYARRFRRLLPAAALNLVVTAVVFRAIADPSALDAGRRAMRAAALYVSNWWFIGESADYFGTDITTSPVAHYWSLSVEEQFYFVWPLVFAGIAFVAGRLGWARRQTLRVVVVGLAGASLVAAVVIAATDANRAYYGTDTRAYQLLAGALVALSPGLLARIGRSRLGVVMPWLSLAAVLGLVVASSSKVTLSPVRLGVVAAALTVVLIASLEAVPDGIGRRALSLRPLVHLGAISYGTYLWHWIVILVIQDGWDLPPYAVAVAAAAVASGIAALSYELVEQPIRRSSRLDRVNPAAIVGGLVVSALVALVAVPRIASDPDRFAGSSQVAGQQTTATPNHVDWEAARGDSFDYASCRPSTPEPCQLTDGTGLVVVVSGESHAAMWIPMWIDIAERRNWELHGALLDYCPWPWGVKHDSVGPACFDDQRHLYESIVPTLDPDLVILAHRPFDNEFDQRDVADSEGKVAREDRDAAVEEAVRRSVASLRAGSDRRVLLIEPIPTARKEDNPLACLSAADVLEECRFVTSERPNPQEEVFHDLASRDGSVFSLDLDGAVCPYDPICDPVVNGEVVRWDGNHLTKAFVRTLGDDVEATLEDLGVV